MKNLSELRPSEFTRAEARALKASEAAMKKGDSQGAVEAKRSQLLNNQLAKEAIEIHDWPGNVRELEIEVDRQVMLG